MKQLLVFLFLFVSLFTKADTLFLNRGQVYSPLTVVNGRVYIATGAGANPVISGLQTLTMTSIGGNKWEATLATRPEVVLINGAKKLPGRYPNSGYLSYEACSPNSVTDNQLTGNWVGGEVWVRKVEWVADRGIITGQIGTTLTYSNISGDNGSPGWKYFIENHIDALDQEGEWCYAGGKLTVYSASLPVVKASQSANLVTGSGGTFINVDFEGANEIAVKGANKLVNCNIKNIGSFGYYANNSSTVSIEGTTFTNIGNVAVFINSCTNAVIKSNSFDTVGIEGLGQGVNITSLEYSCMTIENCTNALVDRNSIKNVGYHGVNFYLSSCTITNNYIDGVCKVKDDGGAIYAYQTTQPSTIQNNIILNSVGAYLTRNDPSYVPAYGIYMDDGCSNIKILDNTVSQTAVAGLYIHNSTNIEILRNLFYNCGVAPTADDAGYTQVLFVDNASSSIRGITMKNNRLIAKNANQNIINMDMQVEDFNLIGSVDNNYYCRPIDDNKVIRLYSNTWSTARFYTLQEWKTFSGLDLNSLKTFKPITATSELRFDYNITDAVVNVNLGGGYSDVAGAAYYGNLAMQPHLGYVLIVNSAVLAIDTPVVTPPVVNPVLKTRLYPNPTSGVVRIELVGVSLPTQILVYDSKGRLVLSRTATQKSLSVNLSGKRSGTYLFKINGTTYKIVKI